MKYTPARDAFYSQVPSVYWGANNASTGFDSELADDIPAGFAGMEITAVTLFHAQWSGGYTAPDALIINFYDAACPPTMDPATTFVIPWGELETEMVYEDAWFVNACTATLPEAVTITETMSIGGVIDNPWGDVAPYNGLCFTDDYVVAGCGEAYWAGEFWGFPRWSPLSAYSGVELDLAYTLISEPVSNETSTWGALKSLYR